MASKLQITCINKSDRQNPHERITHIGGKNADGTTWKLSLADAIKGIEDGKWSFYVSQNGQAVNVIIAKSRYGHKYLKTAADGEQPNNLLSLPECNWIANLYRTINHPLKWSGLPDYEIRDGKLFRTLNHPMGWSGLPDYEIRGDEKVYRTLHHPLGWGGLPDYEFRTQGKLYRTISHPDGWGGLPDYEIRG